MVDVPKTANDWLNTIHDTFAQESDRAAAIVVASMLDEALKLLVQKRLVPAISKERSIIDQYHAPLGSFSARIDAAHQLGLVSHYLARDLHLIRGIRNEFAHNPLKSTFETQAVKDRVEDLQESSDYNVREPKIRTDIGPQGSRWDFLHVTAWILYSLHLEIEKVVPLSERSPEFGYIDFSKLPEELWKRLAEEETT